MKRYEPAGVCVCFWLLAIATAQPINAQIPCYVIVERYCSSIPGNNFVFCSSTPCVNNTCPQGTKEYTPTNDVYNELITEDEALNEGLVYDGPYETFTSPGDVPCRISTNCSSLCQTFIGGLRCMSTWHPNSLPFDAAGQAFVNVEMWKPVIDGVDSCEEWWEW